jgi:hypothetical protein
MKKYAYRLTLQAIRMYRLVRNPGWEPVGELTDSDFFQKIPGHNLSLQQILAVRLE